MISFEEYHPYGTSAYRAMKSGVEVSARRYRYTGKERDDETGLYLMGARYYACWLARWTAADPAGTVDGTNLYAYVRGSPIGLVDPSGTESEYGYDDPDDPAHSMPIPIVRPGPVRRFPKPLTDAYLRVAETLGSMGLRTKDLERAYTRAKRKGEVQVRYTKEGDRAAGRWTPSRGGKPTLVEFSPTSWRNIGRVPSGEAGGTAGVRIATHETAHGSRGRVNEFRRSVAEHIASSHSKLTANQQSRLAEEYIAFQVGHGASTYYEFAQRLASAESPSAVLRLTGEYERQLSTEQVGYYEDAQGAPVEVTLGVSKQARMNSLRRILGIRGTGRQDFRRILESDWAKDKNNFDQDKRTAMLRHLDQLDEKARASAPVAAPASAAQQQQGTYPGGRFAPRSGLMPR